MANDTIKVAISEPLTHVAVLVENMGTEGPRIHGIFTDLESAVKVTSSIYLDRARTTIEAVPINTPLTINLERGAYEFQTNLCNVDAVYDLDGNLLREIP